MKGFAQNIEDMTSKNDNFRHVLYTSTKMQLVTMALKPGEDIGLEVHSENDQFFRFESGEGKVFIDDATYMVGDGSAVIVPAGAEHNVINVSPSQPLKFYTIYAPPHHKDGVIHTTKLQAESDDEEFDGKTTE